MQWWIVLAVLAGLFVVGLVAMIVHDLTQRKHTILRNFPVLGHLRFWLEAVGPELRQYIVTNNDEERPFSRDRRRWIYSTAKGENELFGFGTDNEFFDGYLIVKPATLGPPAPLAAHAAAAWPLPCAKVLGGARGRRDAFRPDSAVYISAMSYGSLSGSAVEALNRGAALAHSLQNTGEGGISVHHRNGGDLIWQIGTGYFGCRDADGHFDLARLVETVEATPQVRAIEFKLSQGAKPGLGGVLPAAKVTPEIAAIRGIPAGRDCISPPRHSAFTNADELLDVVEAVAERTGKPVGIKAAVGDLAFWDELVARMQGRDRGVDFVTIDGGEGGTGAAPLAFSDHVALPFFTGFARVYARFAEAGLHEHVVFFGAGKLGVPQQALLAFALGADMVGVAREAMLSIGCIQAQRCHTGRCPAGVATQNAWLAHGLDPDLKSVRCANYLAALRKELTRLAIVCGTRHPSEVTLAAFEFLADSGLRSTSGIANFGYVPGWGLPSAADRALLGAELDARVATS